MERMDLLEAEESEEDMLEHTILFTQSDTLDPHFNPLSHLGRFTALGAWKH